VQPVAEAVGINGARPYDLRHAFASLLIHEGRLSVVDIAAQLGHNPTVCLDTYAHVMAERAAWGRADQRGGGDHYRSNDVIRVVRGDAGREPAAVLRGL
jgi:integrase